jgi:nitrate/nitrite-specific signal transduction histidine kinase
MTDELTNLAKNFNELSDELKIQYNLLEERGTERTQELEKAKIAADSASSNQLIEHLGYLSVSLDYHSSTCCVLWLD